MKKVITAFVVALFSTSAFAATTNSGTANSDNAVASTSTTIAGGFNPSKGPVGPFIEETGC